VLITRMMDDGDLRFAAHRRRCDADFNPLSS